jgi:5-methyltetrahydrofolate--homocysteine methyltransferase
MKTNVQSEKNTVTLGRETPFVIIGEKINPTGRKKLAAALKEGNYEYVR